MEVVANFSEKVLVDLLQSGCIQLSRRTQVVKNASPAEATLENPSLLDDAALQATVRENPNRDALLKEFGLLATELSGVQVAL